MNINSTKQKHILIGTGISLLIVLAISCSSAVKKTDNTPVQAETLPTVRNSNPDSDSNNAFGLRTVHFDYDKFTIKPAEQRVLAANAKILKQEPQLEILVEGHCDQRGSDEYNYKLGQKRAESVKRFLIAHNISADRIKTISYGKTKLFSSGTTEEDYAANRRGNFLISSENYPRALTLN